MKAKSLSFAFIYFSESGLFNGLRRIQVKKSGLVSSSLQNVSSAPLLVLIAAGSLARRGFGLASG
jgi:hypothetical protein